MPEIVLAIEGGATHSTAGVYTRDGVLLREAEGGPCNPIAYGLETSAATLVRLAHEVLQDDAERAVAVVGSAGVVNRAFAETIGRALCEEAGVREAIVGSDLHPLLHANAAGQAGILVIAGTGSNVLAQDGAGNLLQVGGRGTLLGDEGSAYAIGARALRAAAEAVDGIGPETALVDALTAAAGVGGFEDLVPWSTHATKADVAQLCVTVWQCAETGDDVARTCISREAASLAAHAQAAARRLNLPAGTTVFGQGGLFHRGEFYRNCFADALGDARGLVFRLPPLKGHRAILELTRLAERPPWVGHWLRGQEAPGTLPVTERQAVSEKTLDELDTRDLVTRMAENDAAVPAAVARVAGPIARAVDLAAAALEDGGRLIYLGAGTSGRLGVLDASECPPTFGTDPGQVMGIIAGGEAALRTSVEGAEDDEVAGEKDLAQHEVDSRDFVVGIAASGTTPYTLAALAYARKQGASTALLCCNPAARAPVDVLIAVDTGPEVLAGSTRLKAGTATKLVLNIISTGAMARSGYIHKGLMVRMRPVNEKLVLRARRIVSALSGVNAGAAAALLEQSQNNISVAVLMAVGGIPVEEGKRCWEAAGGKLGVALGRLSG